MPTKRLTADQRHARLIAKVALLAAAGNLIVSISEGHHALTTPWDAWGVPLLAADAEAVQQADKHQDERGREADRLVGRKQTHGKGGEAHHEDGDEEGVLAADEVADAAEQQRAERADQEACGVGRER